MRAARPPAITAAASCSSGWLMLSALAKGSGPALDDPTPWAASAQAMANTARGIQEARIAPIEVLARRRA
ncbi:MAG: hypothetical protein ACREVG_14445 [Burkholderiales bacterium]